ncbi:carboxypeptidase regulatory-like domain-containing protein [Haloarcula sp. Atlit-7R]|uniref:carboxypeptidase regulatory-like domain-containing protein n=1 Tax=Haloarcula sp. Atlit-7R TaxID=2282125 RepID=UPI000EF146CC|nr:carboxypeptidase regulatory-like domain-containing protein [Haloarcula sp. Atlit-7R]RLM96745.1 PGF-CTERM sorting domain-containing protein [Haloarcula sp. Atlit-7R]
MAGTAAGQSQVTLTVTVVDGDGDPLSGIDISATWDDGAGGPSNETTRANGQALIDVPEGADVMLQIDDGEYVRNVPYVVEDAEAESVEVVVSEAATATVSAVTADGQPAETARIRLYRDGNYVVDRNAGSDGTITTQPVEEGEYSVIVTKPGFYRNLTTVSVSGETTATVRISEGSVLLQAEVVDDHFNDSRPIRDATVQVESDNGFDGTVPTLSDGTASVSVPVNDRYALTVTKEGYETVERRVRVAEDETSVDVEIRRTPEITLTPDNRQVIVDANVRFTVTDEYDDPVANVTVSRNGTEVGETDADSEVTATVPTAGNVTFTATAGDLTTTTNVTAFRPGEEATTGGAATTPARTATETTDGSGPGFTVAVTIAALVAVAVLARRRR